jgi:hypothetical protein
LYAYINVRGETITASIWFDDIYENIVVEYVVFENDRGKVWNEDNTDKKKKWKPWKLHTL